MHLAHLALLSFIGGATGVVPAGGVEGSPVVSSLHNFGGFTEAGAASGTIAVTNEPDDLRVFQRSSGGTYNLSIAGTYTGSPSAIQYRIVEHGTDTAVPGHDWQTLDASPSGGAFSGTVSAIPAVGWNNVDVRFSNDFSVADEGSNRWAVGAVVLVIGDSNARNVFQTGTSYTQTEIGSQYTGTTTLGEATGVWAATAASGARQLIDDLAGALGVPVGLVKHGVGSTTLTQEGDTGAGYWLDQTAAEPYPNAIATMDALGACECVVWVNGANDAFQGLVTQAQYQAGLTSLLANLNSDLSAGYMHSEVPFIACQVGRDTNSGRDDDGYADVRAAASAFVDGESQASLVVMADLPLHSDGVHHTEAGYRTLATRVENAYSDRLSLAAVYPGPAISSYMAVDATTIDVGIAHGDGSDFTPTSGITGFEVDLGSGFSAASSAARQDASTIRLTHSSGAVTGVRYLYGAAPDVSGAVTDNTSLALPLAPDNSISETPRVCSVSGTAPGATEDEIRIGGATVVLSISGDTWVASGAAFDAQRQNILDGMVSSQTPANGWNAEVRDKESVGAVVRTSDTIVTVTLSASPGYDIETGEQITVTVPASALLNGASDVVAAPVFGVSPSGASGGWYMRPVLPRDEEERAERIRRERIERGIIDPPKQPVLSLRKPVPARERTERPSVDSALNLKQAIDEDALQAILIEATTQKYTDAKRKAAAVLLLSL